MPSPPAAPPGIVSRGPDANRQDGQRRDDEPNLKAVEQGPVAIGPDHAGQVMTHRAEGAHKKKDILRAPPRLSGGEESGSRAPGCQQRATNPASDPESKGMISTGATLVSCARAVSTWASSPSLERAWPSAFDNSNCLQRQVSLGGHRSHVVWVVRLLNKNKRRVAFLPPASGNNYLL